MKRPLIAHIALLIGLISCKQNYQKTIIAFGSCSHEYDSVQMWGNILNHQPVAWIWLGDNIYGDTYDMEVMKAKYQMQKQRPSYQKMIKSTDIYGVWDDHDFGINDGGKEYTMKDESKKLMLEFLDVSKANQVWNHKGAYQSYIIQQNELKIKLILLDTRYFRDALIDNPDAPPRYLPNDNGTMLGEDQWQWLEKELTDSDADIHLIGSSIQLIPIEQGYEKWGNFPKERTRFFNLITKTTPARPIILSGDRHIAEFSKIALEGLDHPLYEFTSSGLTHTWMSGEPEINAHRVGEMIISKNFGIIEIEHNEKRIKIKLEVRGSDNQVLGQTFLNFAN